jgi:hypothetical protein
MPGILWLDMIYIDCLFVAKGRREEKKERKGKEGKGKENKSKNNKIKKARYFKTTWSISTSHKE